MWLFSLTSINLIYYVLVLERTGHPFHPSMLCCHGLTRPRQQCLALNILVLPQVMWKQSFKQFVKTVFIFFSPQLDLLSVFNLTFPAFNAHLYFRLRSYLKSDLFVFACLSLRPKGKCELLICHLRNTALF